MGEGVETLGTGVGDSGKKWGVSTSPRQVLDPKPPVLILSTSQSPQGKQLCPVPCSCHDVLFGHRPKATGPGDYKPRKQTSS